MSFVVRIVVAMALALTVEYVVAPRLGVSLPGWSSVVIYLALYALLGWWPGKRDSAEIHPRLRDIPLSGPAGRAGAWMVMLRFNLSSLLSLFNPWQAWQQIQQTSGQLLIGWRTRRDQIDPQTAKTATLFTLPVRGEWFVINGGITPETSHSWHILTQRFAYDFVVIDAERRRHRGNGTALDDYFCYGAPIVAAAPGEVVAVRDDIRDAPLVGQALADFLCRDFRGNHVTIRHAAGEYSFYAHLIPGSVPVRQGDRVARGQVIGRCGHSGHSTEPHLHFHVQDSAEFFTAMGVPVRFHNVVIDDDNATASGYLTTGDLVKPSYAPTSTNPAAQPQ